MAEAMISGKYMQATIPALRIQPSEDDNDSGHHDQTHPTAGQRRLSKVVGFDIPSPIKRQRANTEITAQHVTLGKIVQFLLSWSMINGLIRFVESCFV
jgi:hypothetical protein